MAGKARKSREREIRKKAKKAKREMNQARYAAMRDQGQNSKSKRFTLRNRRNRASHNKHQHIIPFCGNHGCKKCYPRKDREHVAVRKQSDAMVKAIRNGTARVLGKLPFPTSRHVKNFTPICQLQS